jgi:hypothetical protein
LLPLLVAEQEVLQLLEQMVVLAVAEVGQTRRVEVRLRPILAVELVLDLVVVRETQMVRFGVAVAVAVVVQLVTEETAVLDLMALQ